MAVVIKKAFSTIKHFVLPQSPSIPSSHRRYTRLLSHYLCSVYDPPEASLLLARLLMALTSVRSLHAFHSRLHLDMNQEQIDPLLVEVFDINRILKVLCQRHDVTARDAEAVDFSAASASALPLPRFRFHRM